MQIVNLPVLSYPKVHVRWSSFIPIQKSRKIMWDSKAASGLETIFFEVKVKRTLEKHRQVNWQLRCY